MGELLSDVHFYNSSSASAANLQSAFKNVWKEKDGVGLE